MIRNLRIPTIISILFNAVVLCGCGGLECGAGTHREGDECVSNIPLGCGEGTVYERGWCVLDDVQDTRVSEVQDITMSETSNRDGGG